MKQDDVFAQAVPPSALAPQFSERVRKLALAQLAPASEASAPLSSTLSGLLVPVLLMSAAIVRTTETMSAAEEIFRMPPQSGQQ